MTDPPTTVAMHTPPGRGGIAVLALAGPGTGCILAQAFRPLPSHARRGDHELRLGHLVDGERVLDEAIVARRGEVAEINLHGGPAVAAAAMHLLDRLGATVLPAPAAAAESFPVAHPAHDNPAVGREMIDALPLARSALVVAALSRQWAAGLAPWRETLAAARATGVAVAVALREAAGRLAAMQRLLHPAEVVLAGPPNAGKSTLANALVGREVSLVHDDAGTTRDWVRELALLDGVPVYLTDTAGLWDAPAGEDVDAEAVRRARRRIERADVVLLLGAGSRSEVPDWLAGRPDGRVLHVAAKIDVAPAFAGADAAVCAPAGEGLDALGERVRRTLGLANFDPGRPAAFTERQASLLTRTAEAVDSGDVHQLRNALGSLLAG